MAVVVLVGLRIAMFVLLITGAAVAQPRPANEQIGSWVLACPAGAANGTCTLRHQAWLLPTGEGRPSTSLEVVRRGGQFVPVVAIRGLSMQMAVGGMLTMNANVGLSFDEGARVGLPCNLDGTDIVCAPAAADTAGVGAALVTARSVVVRIQLGVTGVAALPEQSRTLDLQRTADALARFRSTVPANGTMPSLPGLDWRGFVDLVLREAGFAHF